MFTFLDANSHNMKLLISKYFPPKTIKGKRSQCVCKSHLFLTVLDLYKIFLLNK